MTTVVDASLVATAAVAGDVGVLRECIAPPLLWSELRSALHVAVFRNLLSEELALQALASAASIARREPRDLGTQAWKIAGELGWQKTYDAEYLALATIVGAPIATLDQRMARGARRLGITVREV